MTGPRQKRTRKRNSKNRSCGSAGIAAIVQLEKGEADLWFSSLLGFSLFAPAEALRAKLQGGGWECQLQGDDPFI